MAEPLDDIRALIAAGKKIEAIKCYRELSGCDLRTAKDAVEAMEAGGEPTAPVIAPASGPLTPAQIELIRNLALQGNQIEAIKRYRTWTGAGLRDAKLAVDALVGEVEAMIPERERKSGCLGVVLMAILVGGGVAAASVI